MFSSSRHSGLHTLSLATISVSVSLLRSKALLLAAGTESVLVKEASCRGRTDPVRVGQQTVWLGAKGNWG